MVPRMLAINIAVLSTLALAGVGPARAVAQHVKGIQHLKGPDVKGKSYPGYIKNPPRVPHHRDDSPPVRDDPPPVRDRGTPGQGPQQKQETTEQKQETTEEEPGQGPPALSVGVLVVTTLLITMLVFPLMKGRIGENLFFKLVGLILVINAGLFLVVAGYTQQQVAPMVGLLGIVAGYLLGRDERRGDRAGVERPPSRPGGGNPPPQARPVQGP